MTPVLLSKLLVHNDIRIHPGKVLTRSFMASAGYRIEWFAPHLFRVAIADKPTETELIHERWFAHTNVQTWEVAPGQEVKLPDDSLKAVIHGIIENYKALMQLSADVRTLTEIVRSQPKPLKSSSNIKEFAIPAK